MSEHRGGFSPVARSSFSRRRRCVATAVAALGAGGLIFGGLARAESPSDPVASAGVDVWSDVDGGWSGDELSASGAAGSAHGEGETAPFDASMSLAASARTRSGGSGAIVDADASADLKVEHTPDSEPAPVPDPGVGPIPPFDPDPIPPLDPDPAPPLDPDPDLDPAPLPDPIGGLDPGPVVLPDPGGVVPPDIDPPVAPGRDPGERCASSRTTPRCSDTDDAAGDIGDPDNTGATTEVHPATVVAGGGDDSSPAPDEGVLGGDGDRIAPVAVDGPSGAVLPKTGGGLPTGALRVLGFIAVGRALLSRTGRRFRPSAVAARR